MRSIIQELIGWVVLLGVLFSTAKSTLKKGAEAYKYATKMFKQIKTTPKRQQNVSAEPKKRTIFGRILRTDGFWLGIAFAFQAWALALDVSNPGPLTKSLVMQIAVDCALMAVIFLMAVIIFFVNRFLKWIDQITSTIGGLIEIGGKQTDMIKVVAKASGIESP